jgi:hydroxyethylthiazole kinase-like sugar kinase family protein
MVYGGNILTVAGCLVLICGSIGLIPMESFALGLSSGVRMIATVAITGCLLSAIGYGLQDYFDF